MPWPLYPLNLRKLLQKKNWVGATDSLDTEAKREISTLAMNQTLICELSSPQSGCHTKFPLLSTLYLATYLPNSLTLYHFPSLYIVTLHNLHATQTLTATLNIISMHTTKKRYNNSFNEGM
jgi:hypothetical protein